MNADGAAAAYTGPLRDGVEHDQQPTRAIPEWRMAFADWQQKRTRPTVPRHSHHFGATAGDEVEALPAPPPAAATASGLSASWPRRVAPADPLHLRPADPRAGAASHRTEEEGRKDVGHHSKKKKHIDDDDDDDHDDIPREGVPRRPRPSRTQSPPQHPLSALPMGPALRPLQLTDAAADRLVSALYATDHCGVLSCRAAMRLTGVYAVDNQPQWLAFTSYRDVLTLKHQAQAQPLRGGSSAGGAAALGHHPSLRLVDPLPLLINSKGTSAPISAAALASSTSHVLPSATLSPYRLTELLCMALPELFPGSGSSHTAVGVQPRHNNDRAGSHIVHATTALCPQLNEVYLLHGTTEAKVGHIAEQGFDSRLASPSGNLFGTGTYLTNTLCKAHHYTTPSHRHGSPPPPPMLTGSSSYASTHHARNGAAGHATSPTSTTRAAPSASAGVGVPPDLDHSVTRVLIVARAVLGDAYVTEKAMPTLKRPPERLAALPPPNASSAHFPAATLPPPPLYDSVIGNGKDHKEFILYDRSAVYPWVILTYRVAEGGTGVVQ